MGQYTMLFSCCAHGLLGRPPYLTHLNVWNGFINPSTCCGRYGFGEGWIHPTPTPTATYETYEPMTITCLLQHVSWSRWSTGKTMTQCTGLREGISSSQLTVYHFISLLCSWSCHSVCCAYIFSNPKTGLGLFLVPHGLITLTPFHSGVLDVKHELQNPSSSHFNGGKGKISPTV